MDLEKEFDKIIDRIFGMEKETKYLALLIILGFLLRLMIAVNVPVSADAMVHALHAVNFIDSGKLIDYSQSAGLWHQFTDFMYKLFGVGQTSSRLASVIFGTLSIVSIFLLTKEFFDRKIALVAAVIMAFAPFHLRNISTEMDVMVLFFVSMSGFYIAKGVKNGKISSYFMAGLFMGIAIYTKAYAVLFIPSAVLYVVVNKMIKKENIFDKKVITALVLFLGITFVFAIPTLTHNYLLYKDKGFVDLQFTGALDIGKNISVQYYGWDGHFNAKNEWGSLIFGNASGSKGWSTMPTLLLTMGFILKASPIIFILGILSLIYIFIYRKDKKEYAVFSVVMISVLWIYLSSIFLLSKHYLFIEMFLIPLSAFGFNEISERASKIAKRDVLNWLLVAFAVITLISLAHTNQIYGKSEIAKIIEFKEDHIPKNALIVADSRIYRGQIYWEFYGWPNMEALDFAQITNNQEQIEGTPVAVEVYYVECVTDDCGWGTIGNQPEFNQTMEEFTSFFAQKGELVGTITGPLPDRAYYPLISGNNQREVYRVYKMKVPLKNTILAMANQPKSWFLYNIGYPNPYQEFDSYTTYNIMDTLLDKLAHLISRVALWIAVISIVFVFYVWGKEKD